MIFTSLPKVKLCRLLVKISIVVDKKTYPIFTVSVTITPDFFDLLPFILCVTYSRKIMIFLNITIPPYPPNFGKFHFNVNSCAKNF